MLWLLYKAPALANKAGLVGAIYYKYFVVLIKLFYNHAYFILFAD